jgi:hypothetical protein
MNDYDQFLMAVRKWGEQEWMNQYFDLLKRIFTQFNVTSATPQLALTVTKNNQLNVNIGHRYVSCPWGEESVAMIFPLESNETEFNCEFVEYFNKQKVKEAKWVIYKWPEKTVFPEPLYHQWAKAFKAEIERAKKTPQKKRHSDLFYDTIMEMELRKQVFQNCYDREIES